jgi:parallel beta-helix repeat protein
MTLFLVEGKVKLRRLISGLLLTMLIVNILTLSFNIKPARSSPATGYTDVLTNGDFETGDFSGWSVGGVCSVSGTVVHNGSYSAYVSDETYDNWIAQNIAEPADRDCDLEAWVYPLKVGNLGDAYSASSYIRLWFYNASSMSPAFDVLYLWCWNNDILMNGNWSNGVHFLLPFTASAWNLLSRNVTQDVCLYFVGINLSKYVLYSITAVYHYSNGDPGAFYLDDLNAQLGPRTWIVDDDGPADFHTIQEAINAASDGDTVYVRAGTYAENVVLNKSLSLIGEDAETTIIDGEYRPGAIGAAVTAEGVTITGFTLRQSGTGISVRNSSTVISGNILVQNWNGLEVYPDTSNNLITNNTFGGGYDSYDYAYVGIRLILSTTNNTIEKNVIGTYPRGFHEGIYVAGSQNNSIIGNTVEYEYEYGLRIEGSNNEIADNIIEHCVWCGLWVSGDYSYTNWIRNNTMDGCKHGIIMDAPENIIEQNTISNSFEYGLWLEDDNSIFHNNFVNNTNQVLVENSSFASFWDNGYPSGGNYWSDYNGTDFYHGKYQNETGSDGIGDTPYVIDLDNQDNYPSMKPFPWDQHDIGITGLGTSRNVCGQGYITNVSVMVFNYGENAETFNLTVYVNDTMPVEMVSLELAGRTPVTVDFTWNTTGFAFGNYTISAYAEPVPGETDTADNSIADGWVLVTEVGDFGGGVPPAFFSCDGSVDGKDLSLFLQCFKGTAPAEAMYLGDLGGGVIPQFYDCDGKVDGKDLALFLMCYKGLGP